jgi:hypothetical protein
LLTFAGLPRLLVTSVAGEQKCPACIQHRLGRRMSAQACVAAVVEDNVGRRLKECGPARIAGAAGGIAA